MCHFIQPSGAQCYHSSGELFRFLLKQWMSLLNEQIAMLAKEELPLERWKDLLSLIDQLCHSGDVNERLVCACTHVIEQEREWNFISCSQQKLCMSGSTYLCHGPTGRSAASQFSAGYFGRTCENVCVTCDAEDVMVLYCHCSFMPISVHCSLCFRQHWKIILL